MTGWIISYEEHKEKEMLNNINSIKNLEFEDLPFNCIAVDGEKDDIMKLKKKPFVKSIEKEGIFQG